MRVEILRSVMISGEPAAVGSILDLALNDAQLLISCNKAKLAPEPEAVVETIKASETETIQEDEVAPMPEPRRTRKPRTPQE